MSSYQFCLEKYQSCPIGLEGRENIVSRNLSDGLLSKPNDGIHGTVKCSLLFLNQRSLAILRLREDNIHSGNLLYLFLFCILLIYFTTNKYIAEYRGE
jgi:hypothetical protein